MNFKRCYVGFCQFIGMIFVYLICFHIYSANAQSLSTKGQKFKCGILVKVNAYRAQSNHACLRRNTYLDKAAQNYAAWLAKNLTQNSNIKFGHEADGRTPTQRAEAVGYKAKPDSVKKTVTKHKKANGSVVTRTVRKITSHKYVGENILYFEGTLCDPNTFVKDAFDGWKNSKTHRRNMLSPKWNATGLGIAFNKESNRCFAVQVFGQAKIRQSSQSCRARC